MSMTPTDLINIYNRMVPLVAVKTAALPKVTAGKRPQTPGLQKHDDATREKAELLLEALRRYDYPPGPYLASCFGKHSWAKLPDGIDKLTRPAYVDYYRDNREEAGEWWANVKREIDATEPIKLPAGHEIVRKRMMATGGPDFCFANRMFTGGYNQHSPTCQPCPLKSRCRE